MRVMVPAGSAPPGGWASGQRVGLDDQEVHHLRVRRSKEGEQVEVLDGAGLRGRGVLIQTGKVWSVELENFARESPLPELTLAVAAGDRDRFSWMIEKSVELGVTRILPVNSARTSGVATGVKASHLERLRRQALEALKQCGSAWVTQIDEPVSLEDFLGKAIAGSGWLGDAAGSLPPSSLDGSPIVVVIGPEGGLTEDERSRVIAAGYQPTRLGGNTLRFETAAVAAAALAGVARLRGRNG
jgi:16S rRNA (uracil1498-N3)-methyltransferase